MYNNFNSGNAQATLFDVTPTQTPARSLRRRGDV